MKNDSRKCIGLRNGANLWCIEPAAPPRLTSQRGPCGPQGCPNDRGRGGCKTSEAPLGGSGALFSETLADVVEEGL